MKEFYSEGMAKHTGLGS